MPYLLLIIMEFRSQDTRTFRCAQTCVAGTRRGNASSDAVALDSAAGPDPIGTHVSATPRWTETDAKQGRFLGVQIRTGRVGTPAKPSTGDYGTRLDSKTRLTGEIRGHPTGYGAIREDTSTRTYLLLLLRTTVAVVTVGVAGESGCGGGGGRGGAAILVVGAAFAPKCACVRTLARTPRKRVVTAATVVAVPLRMMYECICDYTIPNTLKRNAYLYSNNYNDNIITSCIISTCVHNIRCIGILPTLREVGI